MSYKLVVSEKPSIGAAYAKVLGATNRQNGYLEGNGYLVSWCIGHLVELAPPNIYRSVLKKRAACIGTVQNEGDWHSPTSILQRKNGGCIDKSPACRNNASFQSAYETICAAILYMSFHNVLCRSS